MWMEVLMMERRDKVNYYLDFPILQMFVYEKLQE